MEGKCLRDTHVHTPLVRITTLHWTTVICAASSAPWSVARGQSSDQWSASVARGHCIQHVQLRWPACSSSRRAEKRARGRSERFVSGSLCCSEFYNDIVSTTGDRLTLYGAYHACVSYDAPRMSKARYFTVKLRFTGHRIP